MNPIKDGRYPITLDRERHILFSLNVLIEMEEKIGDIANLPKLFEEKGALKNLRWLLTRIVNEGAAEGEEQMTENQLGKYIHSGNIVYMKDIILNAFNFATAGNTEGENSPDDDFDDEGDEKNAKNGQSR